MSQVFIRKMQLVSLQWMYSHYEKRVQSEASLSEIIAMVCNGTYRKHIEDYRLARATEEQAAKLENRKVNKVQKEKYVPSFMPHAYIQDKKVKLKNKKDETEHHRWEATGYVHIDLDNIPANDVPRVIDAIESTYPAAMFQSPSGDGLKVFYRHNKSAFTLAEKQDFTLAVRFFVRDLLERLDLGNYYDPAACDPNRQCYFSFDPSAKYFEENTPADLQLAYDNLAAARLELTSLQQQRKQLVQVVPNVITSELLNARAEELQQRFIKHVNQSNAHGNGESFKLACWMVCSGYDDYAIISKLTELHAVLNGNWQPEEKLMNARRKVQDNRNRYASETIEICNKVDTSEYNKLNEKIADVEKYIKAGKNTIKLKYSDLALHIISTAPRSRNLVRHAHEYAEQAKRIYRALEMNRVVTVVENAGSGKSRTMGELAQLVYLDKIGDYENAWKGMVFCTNTRANRDAFVLANPQFKVWKGITELVYEVTLSKAASMKCGELYSDDTFCGSALEELVNTGFITAAQHTEITHAIIENMKITEESFVACCHAKIMQKTLLTKFSKHIVVFDEMAADDVMHIDVGASCKVFNDRIEVQATDADKEKAVQNFMEIVELREGGIVMLSAERSLHRAFGDKTIPNLKMKQTYPGITYSMAHLGAPKVLEDDSLQVVIVKSLANNVNTQSGSAADDRAMIAGHLRKFGYTVISDGKDANGNAIGDSTIEGCKGSNNMMAKKTAVLIGNPSPYAIGDMMMRLGCDEDTAVSVIISDQANQAIGRNVGYRNRGSECLLVIAAGLLKSGKSLELDVLTPYVYNIAGKCNLENAPTAIRDIFKDFTKDGLNQASIVADVCLAAIAAGPVLVGDISKLAKAELKQRGVSTYELNHAGILTAVYVMLVARGAGKKRDRFNGKQGTYWIMTS